MQVEGEISKNIKKLRSEREMTLEQLAQKVGCSKSYISQLEKGLTTPSLSMLGKLAETLEVPVADFFQHPSGQDKDAWHLPKEQRRSINYPDGKVTSQLLTRGIFQKKMQPLISIIRPGGSSNEGGTMHHAPGSEEFVLVLKGTLDFEINGAPVTLKEGDSLYFNGELPHMWKNESQETAEVLFMWTPPVW